MGPADDAYVLDEYTKVITFTEDGGQTWIE